MNKNPHPPKKKNQIYHYNLFEFDQKLSNKFAYNASRHFPDDNYQPNSQNQFANIIDPNQLGYPITLIEGQLRLIIYHEGIGNYPMPGNYIQYRKKLYYEGQANQLQKDVANCVYDFKQNSEPLQLILSMSKNQFKAKAFLGPEMSTKIYKSSPANKILVLEIQIVQISQIPLDDNFSHLQRYHAQIIKHSIEGDYAFQNRDLEKSLYHYQFAVQRIFNEYYSNTLQFHKNQIKKQEKKQFKKYLHHHQKIKDLQQRLQYQTLMKNKHSVELIEQYSEKIAVKGVQVAFLAKQYLKVIKWSQQILINPKYDKSLRVLLARAKSYLFLEQFDRAIADLNYARMVHPQNQIIQKQIIIAEQKRKQFRAIMERQQSKGNINKINQQKSTSK